MLPQPLPDPGDVIFWEKDVTQNDKTYWLANHVGIYIGNEQFIGTRLLIQIKLPQKILVVCIKTEYRTMQDGRILKSPYK